MSLHHLPLHYTSAEKWISGQPKYGQARMRCATDESSPRLPRSPALHVCKTERGRGGKEGGWANNENKSKEKKKPAEATFEWSSGVHTARTLRAPRGVNMTRERMQGRSLSLGDVNILPRLLTRRSSLKTHSSCPLDSVRHALCSAFGAQNYVVESRMKCTCMDCTFHAHHHVKDIETVVLKKKKGSLRST